MLLAEVTDQHYSTQMANPSGASSSSSSSNNNKLSVLQCDRLALYLEQVSLPNVEQPLSSLEAAFVLESIPKEDGGQVSREHFRKWFDLNNSNEDNNVCVQMATLNFKLLFLYVCACFSQDDGRQANTTDSSSKKRRKATSNSNSSSSVSGAGSGWVRVAEAVKRNECRFFAQLLLEDYLVNQVSTPLY